MTDQIEEKMIELNVEETDAVSGGSGYIIAVTRSDDGGGAMGSGHERG